MDRRKGIKGKGLRGKDSRIRGKEERAEPAAVGGLRLKVGGEKTEEEGWKIRR